MENIKEIMGISIDSLKNFFDNNNTVENLEDLNNIYDKFCSEVEPLDKSEFLDICCYFLYDYWPAPIRYNYNPQLYHKMGQLNLEFDWEEN